METVNFLLGGLGGQGVLFMTKVLARTALNNALDVMAAETHGMAQRGGSVVSHLKIGKMESSLVGTGSAHFLIALEENEAYRNIPFLASGGRMYANVSGNIFPRLEVKPYLERIGVASHFMDAGNLAIELGATMSSNLILLGFFSSFGEGPFSHEQLRAAIDQISPSRFREINLKVFDAGFRWMKDESG